MEEEALPPSGPIIVHVRSDAGYSQFIHRARSLAAQNQPDTELDRMTTLDFEGLGAINSILWETFVGRQSIEGGNRCFAFPSLHRIQIADERSQDGWSSRPERAASDDMHQFACSLPIAFAMLTVFSQSRQSAKLLYEARPNPSLVLSFREENPSAKILKGSLRLRTQTDAQAPEPLATAEVEVSLDLKALRQVFRNKLKEFGNKEETAIEWNDLLTALTHSLMRGAAAVINLATSRQGLSEQLRPFEPSETDAGDTTLFVVSASLQDVDIIQKTIDGFWKEIPGLDVDPRINVKHVTGDTEFGVTEDTTASIDPLDALDGPERSEGTEKG